MRSLHTHVLGDSNIPVLEVKTLDWKRSGNFSLVTRLRNKAGNSARSFDPKSFYLTS